MNTRTQIFLQFLIVIALGILLHFTYQWSNENFLVGLFSATNESVWEHLKLLFFPMFFLTLWDMFTGRKTEHYFLSARVVGIIAGLLFIITAFYTFEGVIGKNINWLDVVIYIAGVAFAFWVEHKVYKKHSLSNHKAALVVLLGLMALFIIFTIAPPPIGLFDVKG